MFVIQSRVSRDWITRFIPSGINSRYAHNYGTVKNACSDTKESFFFGGLSPPKKKLPSPRPLRLCGENSILDKNETKSNLLNSVDPLCHKEGCPVGTGY
jgi:hypothetical protein